MVHMHALELHKVSFSFGRNMRHFFDRVSISFPVSKIHFIQGRNGVGKSTLFNVLRGNIHAQEKITGLIRIDGAEYPFSEKNRDHLKDLDSVVKMVHQNFDAMLADNLTFEENLRVARMVRYPGLHRLPEHEKLPAFVERFGIPRNTPVFSLSGGQRQVLAILMVLQKKVKILLLDEPTAALDNQNSRLVMEFLQTLVTNTGLTVLVISHDRDLVETYAQTGHYSIEVDMQTEVRTLHYHDRVKRTR